MRSIKEAALIPLSGFKALAESPGLYLGSLIAIGLIANDPYVSTAAISAADLIGAHLYYEIFKPEIKSAISSHYGLPGEYMGSDELLWPFLRGRDKAIAE